MPCPQRTELKPSQRWEVINLPTFLATQPQRTPSNPSQATPHLYSVHCGILGHGQEKWLDSYSSWIDLPYKLTEGSMPTGMLGWATATYPLIPTFHQEC